MSRKSIWEFLASITASLLVGMLLADAPRPVVYGMAWLYLFFQTMEIIRFIRE